MSFAHLTDLHLLQEELEEIKKSIVKYIPEEDDFDIDSFMEEILYWYNSTSTERLQVVNSIAVNLNFEIQDKEIKKGILEDLASIGKSDFDFIENEKAFIRLLGSSWGVEFEVE